MSITIIRRLGILFLIACVAFGLFMFWLQRSLGGPNFHYLTMYDMDVIADAIKGHHQEEGVWLALLTQIPQWPDLKMEMQFNGLDPWGSAFQYKPPTDESRGELRSAGPDRKFQTDDDITLTFPKPKTDRYDYPDNP